MAKYPYKQYARLMADRFGLKIVRSRKQVVMSIYAADGTLIFTGFSRSAPEIGWENLWRNAHIAIEKYTGVSLFECSDDIYEEWLKRKKKI